jgi:hypothetical protein
MSPLIRMTATWALRFFSAGIIVLGINGCHTSDDVTQTTEPRAAPSKPKSGDVPTRILGGIAPQENHEGSWFFKMMGPTEAVSAQEKAFDSFLASVKFNDRDEKPVTWTLPEGWREGPRRAGRYATILAGPIDDSVELSIIPAGGSLLENVNRWCGQVGLPKVKDEELSTTSREITTDQGKKMTRVDLRGMATKGEQMPPFMKGK